MGYYHMDYTLDTLPHPQQIRMKKNEKTGNNKSIILLMTITRWYERVYFIQGTVVWIISKGVINIEYKRQSRFRLKKTQRIKCENMCVDT